MIKNYKNKYYKYKCKYIKLKGGAISSSIDTLSVEEETLDPRQIERQLLLEDSNNHRLIKCHGYTNGRSFIIPNNTYVITINNIGTPVCISDKLDTYLTNVLQNINTKPIFEDNNRSLLEMSSLSNNETKINEKIRNVLPKTNILFRNHIPGMKMSDMVLNFGTKPCSNKNNRCGVEIINIDKEIYNINIDEVLDDLKDKEPSTHLNSTNTKNIININSQYYLEELINNENKIKIKILVEEIEKINYEITQLEQNKEILYDLSELRKIIEDKITELNTRERLYTESTSRLEEYRNNTEINHIITLKDDEITLQNIVNNYGPGIYMIRACRSFSGCISEETKILYRQRSFENRK
jgi:hypothetical protein